MFIRNMLYFIENTQNSVIQKHLIDLLQSYSRTALQQVN